MNAVTQCALNSIEKDIESMIAIQNVHGTEEEKAEVMRLAAEVMTFKLMDSGIIPTLSDANKKIFIGTVTDIMTAISKAVN